MWFHHAEMRQAKPRRATFQHHRLKRVRRSSTKEHERAERSRQGHSATGPSDPPLATPPGHRLKNGSRPAPGRPLASGQSPSSLADLTTKPMSQTDDISGLLCRYGSADLFCVGPYVRGRIAYRSGGRVGTCYSQGLFLTPLWNMSGCKPEGRLDTLGPQRVLELAACSYCSRGRAELPLNCSRKPEPIEFHTRREPCPIDEPEHRPS